MIKIVQFFLDNSKLTVVLSFFVLLFGILGLMKINSESYPAVNFATALINTHYEGASSEDIEIKITRPLEDEIRKVSGLKEVRSFSSSGHSTVVVLVDTDRENVDEVMNDLQKAVDRVTDLPSDLRDKPVFTEINSEEFPAIEIAVIGQNKERIRDRVSDMLKEDLEDVKSVLNVRLIGFNPREFKVNMSPDDLDKNHVGIQSILNQIILRNRNIPGGQIEHDEKIHNVRVESEITSVDELSRIPIRTNFSGEKVLLKNLAHLEDGEEEAKKLVRIDGIPATLLVVTKKAGADTLKLVDDVQSRLKIYQESPLVLKNNLKVEVYRDEAEKVKNKLDILSSNAFVGLALVIIFLFIFLPGRIGLMASLSLPMAVMATIGMMPVMGMNLDAITILALVIALGMLVDNSVVITEYYSRLRQEGVMPKLAILRSVEQLWGPITATAMTTIAAFVPMLVTKGIMGEFIKFIPIIVSLSLIISLIESFFFLPSRLLWVGKSVETNKKKNKPHWFSHVAKSFESFMRLALRFRYFVGLIFSGIIIGSLLFMFKFNSFELFPAEQTEVYVGRLEMDRGMSLEQTDKAMAEISIKVKEKMGIHADKVVTRAGTSTMGPTDPKGGNGDYYGLLLLYVTEKASFDLDYVDVLNDLRSIKLEKLAGGKLTFEALVNGPPVGLPINLTLRSNNLKKLDEVLENLKTRLSKIEGVYDLQDDQVFGPGQIFVDFDYVNMSRLGLDVTAAGETIRLAVEGKIASKVILNNKEVNIRVSLLDQNRPKLQDLENLKIENSQGHLIPLNRFAKLRYEDGAADIKRFDFKKSKTILGQVKKDLITAQEVNSQLRKWLDQEILSDYPEVTYVFGGEERNTRESMESLFDALMLALVGIFALLVFMFKSYLRPGIIMSTIPLGLVGPSIAFYFHNRSISFLAMIGVIGLAGIIVNSGIVLISFIDDLRKEGKLSLDEILVKASGMRLRAVLVTSLTTISGLFPTAYGIGGMDSMLVPMTLAMAWGLTSGTILTLIWVPCAYAINEDMVNAASSFLNKIKGRKKTLFSN